MKERKNKKKKLTFVIREFTNPSDCSNATNDELVLFTFVHSDDISSFSFCLKSSSHSIWDIIYEHSDGWALVGTGQSQELGAQNQRKNGTENKKNKNAKSSENKMIFLAFFKPRNERTNVFASMHTRYDVYLKNGKYQKIEYEFCRRELVVEFVSKNQTVFFCLD